MRRPRSQVARRAAVLATVLAVVLLATAAVANAKAPKGRWLSGDVQTHTNLTDGNQSQVEVDHQAFGVYGLDYLANAEPGGTSAADPTAVPFVTPVARWLTLAEYSFPIVLSERETYPERAVIQGLEWDAPNHQQVNVGIVGAGNEPSGISNFEYRFDSKDSDLIRANEGTKVVTHTDTYTSTITGATEAGTTVTITTLAAHNAHVGDSVTIDGVANAGYNGIVTVVSVPSDTTFTFTSATSGLPASGGGTVTLKVLVTDLLAAPFSKLNTAKALPTDADNTVVGAQWLEDNFGKQAYAVVAHPSMNNQWHVGDFRAMNDAAPDVAIGMQGIPGNQSSFARGGYGSFIKADGTLGTAATADAALTAKARTYGGADYMTAKVGGVWDSLLGEGRHFWIFNDSEFYKYNKSFKDASGNTIGIQYYGFYPGQYNKTWTFAKKDTPQAVVDGMHSGDSFVANGDLIDGLRFTVKSGKKSATMGQTFRVRPGKRVTITVAIHSPRQNQNGDRPVVNHVDLIVGNVTGFISPSSPEYTSKDTNSSTHVLKTFTKRNWKKAKGGWRTMVVRVKGTANMYFRLRGTNVAPNTANKTDAQGNPLDDELGYAPIPNPADGGATMTAPVNSPDIAWADLWFYSNPIFLKTGTTAH
jgi:hypothetical protein